MCNEEGPLADWLCRGLREHVDEMVACDPYRNALISRGGEKTDALDWRKLADLYRSGHIRVVYHALDADRSYFKQHVQLYHERVRHRVAEGQKIIWRLRRLGVKVGRQEFARPAFRHELLERLSLDPVPREDLRMLLESYEQACEQVRQLDRRLTKLARQGPVIRRLQEVPGFRWIRASTFVAYVDSPFRFQSKQRLWKYMGIGLERHQSGTGSGWLSLPKRYNHALKNVILGAARSAVVQGENVFADAYERWVQQGCSSRIARRNVARSLATVMWGMWKGGSAFDPHLVSPTPTGRRGMAADGASSQHAGG